MSWFNGWKNVGIYKTLIVINKKKLKKYIFYWHTQTIQITHSDVAHSSAAHNKPRLNHSRRKVRNGAMELTSPFNIESQKLCYWEQWAIFMSDKIMVPLNSVGVRYSPIGLSWEFRGHLGHKRSEDGISLDHMIPMMPCFSPMGSKIHSAGSVTLFRYWHESRDLLSWLSPHGIRNSRMIYQSTADLYIATLYNN